MNLGKIGDLKYEITELGKQLRKELEPVDRGMLALGFTDKRIENCSISDCLKIADMVLKIKDF